VIDDNEKINIRKEAARTLEEILIHDAYSSICVNQHLMKFPATVDERDRRLYTNLVYTTLEHLPTIDAGLAAWSSVPMRKMKPWILSCLRLGLAQLMYMEKIPSSAAVHETVELVKKSPYRSLAGFVNGVLRGALRANLQVPQPDPEREPMAAFALAYDMPVWITELWYRAYGPEQTQELLMRSQGHKPLCCRINRCKIDPEEGKKRLEQALEAEHIVPSTILPEAFFIEYSGDITQWDLYREGILSLQDESSMLAALATGVQPGDQVLDLCAAPGGKSIVMAQQMNNQGRIRSCDLHEHRVELIRRNAQRLGLTCIEPQQADGTAADSVEEKKWDVVLVDAPCSGLGILRSKPDIKYHRRAEEQQALSDLQAALLENAARGVKVGGRLVYSTCTINPAENEDRIERFEREHPEYEPVDLEKELPFLPECDRLWKKYLLLYPKKGGRDGFFVAAMKRVK
jgi:16S rRNA (cytosine967-C5)-methyltransferase